MTWKISNTSIDPDPYYGAVSLLLHGDGTNGSTNIIDSSYEPKTVTAFGNAQISTAQSRFNGSSLAFDGSGDYLAVSSSADFQLGSGEFTVELWVWFINLSGDRGFVGGSINGSPDFAWRTGVGLSIGRINVAWDSVFAWTPLVDTWYHIAFCRSGSSLRAFVNGTQVGSTVTNTQSYSWSGAALIGTSAPTTRNLPGYIDELRITKGIARYTSNFTPPTRAFPDF